jgi:catechol 2,3-dioxygenase-like lactoylglutathione lyase family enzyme
MIDHIGFAVSNMQRSKTFYVDALKPLGIGVVVEVTAEQTGADAHAGFGKDNKAFFWIGGGAKPKGGSHVAFTAPHAGRCRFLLPRGFGRRRPGQWPAGVKASLPPDHLRGVRPRP